ncbi:XRE family transcriptional regulator [Marinitoga sp. 1197]|uniref:helix-turn-helix domain-containing protein n=1 Tax=Marinitoga sp. 1197 TaxID=1428449 RepID=UPI000640EF5F|nr:helix-turn-helix transcriptional regulator [Marinitoga sp. 1197]AJW76954.1 transcriptional regulator, XRE family [Marinitoga camini virus 1]KLO23995.1 XRE family transcriptional regulator [Marinitoga sp. 1197]
MCFSERLKQLREEKGISQRQLARDLNFSSAAVSLYEAGQREPTLTALEKLAKYFNVSLDYLTGLSNKNNELPDFVKEQITKIDELKSLKLSEKLEIIGNELIDISKKIKDFE